MIKGKRPIFLSLILVLFATTAVLMGCGGGDNADSGTRENSNRSTVAVFLADGPTDEFDNIWIEVRDISLLPQNDGEPVVIYEAESGTPLDLLTLQDDDMLLSVNSEVPTGTYNKIRLTVEKVYGQKGDQIIDFHLDSNKIDLNPKGVINVSSDETLSLRLDIDAEKSIQVEGSTYNFRPVVFVDAGPMEDSRPCHHLVKGDITELIYAEQDKEKIIGFRMSPFNGKAALDVHFQDNIAIFDDKGQPAGPEALAVEESVCINGELGTDGRFLADMVVIGDVQTLTGEVKSAVQDNQFQMGSGSSWDHRMPNDSRKSDLEAKTVMLFDSTIIMIGDKPADTENIQPGLRARIVGKMGAETKTMNAIAIYLKEQRIKGRLKAIEAVDGGHMLTILTHMDTPDGPPADGDETDENDIPDEGEKPTPEDKPDPENKPDGENQTDDEIKKGCHAAEREIKVFLPESAPIDVKNGSEVAVDALKTMVECDTNPAVHITVNTVAGPDETIQAGALTVWPETIRMTVESVDVENRIITGIVGRKVRDDGAIHVIVPEGTSIWKHSEASQETITLQDIQKNDSLMVTGLITACDPRSYEAVTVVAMPGCMPPDEPCEPEKKKIEMKVAAFEIGEDGITGFIKGENDILIEVTEKTVFMDRVQSGPIEITFGDLALGDLLECKIVMPCDNDTAQALVVARVNPDDDSPKPPHDDCMPHEVLKEVVVEDVNPEEGIIITSEKETVLVPESTPIYTEGPNGEEKLSLADLKQGDILEIKAKQPCKEGPDLVAYSIVKLSTTM